MTDPMSVKYVGDAQIIFEDESIVVVWQPGQSDFMLVTFGDLANLASGASFYAGVPVRKLGLTCIGFMAKNPNWYPKKSVAKAVASIGEYFTGVKEVIAYGGSMGGYAAIKYSAALNATAVAAFCPQWTIDKGECNGRNPGYQEHFKNDMAGMGIRPEDVSGSLYVFFDPTHENDKYHAERISSMSTQAKHIPIRSVGHHVTSVLAGTDNMISILNMIRSNDYLGLRRLSNKIRKRHHTTAALLMPKIANRHPYLLRNIIFNPKFGEDNDEYDVIKLKTDALRLFSEQGNANLALEAVESIQSNGICRIRKRMLDGYRNLLHDQLSVQSRAISTVHGSIIAYSAIQGSLVHRARSEVLSRVYLFPVIIFKYRDVSVLGVGLDGRDYLCQVTSKGDVRLADIGGVEVEMRTLITCFAQSKNVIQAKCRDFFVCAERGGNVAFNRKVAKEWETFELHE
ncbi:MULTISPECIES: hypothetical protein [unclassified Pseudomonas]|uniref:hypothetical protein n=1 Tax=unclassified Pseudomonas TaxID=196821 RepID=UPI001068BE15|nr:MULTISPECIES: hypothetical protein [unclassified Pseudomonas]